LKQAAFIHHAECLDIKLDSMRRLFRLHSDLGVMVLFGLFTTGFMLFMNFRRKKNGIVVMWGLLLSFIIRSAIIIQMSHFYRVMKMKSAKPKPVPTRSFEYYRSYLVDFFSNIL